ncbi:ABC transporter permease [Paraburkholderia sp. Ac-20336]|uniref:ABC transporter permease n=1 Tax=Paraburkholderia sp. Ac-20336 TaxID=2703886 RepID=UPI0019803E1D|nr:ABC transporter permease [Paraburkholderia sp. Ac-20336]MBN3801926.1 ABC transporter permease [Paraburkholderia sp. Ac-20336]
MSATAKKRSKRSIAAGLYPVLAIAAFFLIWEGAVRALHIPSYLLPMPSDIFGEIYQNAGVLVHHGQATLLVILASFITSVLLGVPLALLISFSPFARRMIYPLIVFSQMIPKIAIAPLFVIWFGFGFVPKLLIAVLISFFAVVIQSIVGFTSLRPQPIRVAQSMGATRLDLFFKVRLPHALPNIFAGLKMAMASSAIGAIVGEFIASQQGLGYLVLVANGQMDTKLAFAGMLILSVMGIVLYFIVELAERMMTGWRTAQRG